MTTPRDTLPGPFVAGTPRAVAGNAPMLLIGADRVWCVRTGQLELFVVRTDDDAARGLRRHFMSVAAGDLLFGMESTAGDGLSLLATGVVGTEVVEIPIATLRAAVEADASTAARIAEGIDTWVMGISGGLTRHIVPKPRADVRLGADETAVVPEGNLVMVPRGVAWLRQRTGSSLFIDMEETADAAGRVPLCHDTWLRALTTTEMDAVDTPAALREGTAWAGLNALHTLALACEAFNSTLGSVDEFNRLTEKAERRERTRRGALEQLASVMGDAPTQAAAAEQSDDPLFLACAAVGRAAGITMRPAPKRIADHVARHRDPLLEIVKAARARTRPVTLDEGWWRSDQGPLLAFRREDGAPVALLPRTHDQYDLFDPATGGTTPVTAALAASLAPTARMFYAGIGTEVMRASRLLAFGLRGTGPDLRRVAAVTAVGGIFGIFLPLATGLVFDSIVPQAERGALSQIALGLAVIAIATAVFEVTRSLALMRVEHRLDASISAAVMDRILTLPPQFFREFSSGDLGTRTMAFSTLRELLTSSVLGLAFTSIMALPSLVLMFVIDAGLAALACAILVFTMAITFFAARRQFRLQQEEQRLAGRLAGLVLEFLTGISKLRVAGAEGDAFAVWARIFGEKRRVSYAVRALGNLLGAYKGVLPLLALTAILAGVVYVPRDTPLETGTFLAFNAAFTQVFAATVGLFTAALALLSAIPLYERARPILEAVPEVTDAQQDPGELSGDIELSHVSFRYDPAGPPVLDDISLRMRPGEFVAVVGPSGSGKSTLLRLLLGFERPERGTVQYDGQNLDALDVSAVRRQLGVVLQHSKIMPGDIFRNIVGSTLLTIDDAWEAARRAALDGDIREMPMGMHTVISEGGGTFSGGQRQRLLIARAIAQGPRILFFDEATSALDNTTQAVVSASLEGLQATRFVIAHRLSTIVNADRIIVMVGGRIVQTGTYEELFATAGVFQDLVRRQLA